MTEGLDLIHKLVATGQMRVHLGHGQIYNIYEKALNVVEQKIKIQEDKDTRIDCVSAANHDLILQLDKPGRGGVLIISKYLFLEGSVMIAPGEQTFFEVERKPGLSAGRCEALYYRVRWVPPCRVN